MTDLATWLLAQIAEDERHASVLVASIGGPDSPFGNVVSSTFSLSKGERYSEGFNDITEAVQAWIAENGKPRDPFRLAECDAKRRILDLHADNRHLYNGRAYGDCVLCADGVSTGDFGSNVEHPPWPCDTIHALALPYSDRPGYDEEWWTA